MMGKRVRATAAVIALALAGTATACGGEEERSGDGAGVSRVKVGGIFALSGATSDVGTPYADGIKGFVRYWNAAAEGPRIDLLSEDYSYKTAVAERLYSRLKRENVVAFQGWGTADTEALRRRVTADRLPFMSASLAETLTDPSKTPFNFVAATSYDDQMRIALRWISERASGAEVASFHHASPFGMSPQRAGARTARRLGLGFTRYAMPANAERYPRLLRAVRSRRTKFVVIQATANDAAVLAERIAEYAPGVRIVCLNWCADERFIERAGDAADGTVGVMPFAPVSVQADGLAQPRRFLSKGGRTLDQEGLHYVQGWYTMALMAQGIKRAAERGKVTGESIRQALEAMDAFDTGGLSAPMDFTAKSHAGMQGSRLYVVRNERWSQLTGLQTVP